MGVKRKTVRKRACPRWEREKDSLTDLHKGTHNCAAAIRGNRLEASLAALRSAADERGESPRARPRAADPAGARSTLRSDVIPPRRAEGGASRRTARPLSQCAAIIFPHEWATAVRGRARCTPLFLVGFPAASAVLVLRKNPPPWHCMRSCRLSGRPDYRSRARARLEEAPRSSDRWRGSKLRMYRETEKKFGFMSMNGALRKISGWVGQRPSKVICRWFF